MKNIWLLIIWVGIAQTAMGQNLIPLWEDQVPLARENAEADIPMIIPYPAENANGTAVVIFPGGGYVTLAMDHEGHQVAQWLNTLGISAFVVKYRTADREAEGKLHPAPYLDGQRGIRWVRHHAEKYGIDPSRTGILGFSAGGHLASTLGTRFNRYPEYDRDEIDQQNGRPDFMILGYPVITFTTGYTHEGSRKFLLGEDPEPDLVLSLSNELMVTESTPPAFLVHTSEDKAVPSENSILFYRAMQDKGIISEMHIFSRGRHGLGLGTDELPFSKWPELCAAWLREIGMRP